MGQSRGRFSRAVSACKLHRSIFMSLASSVRCDDEGDLGRAESWRALGSKGAVRLPGLSEARLHASVSGARSALAEQLLAGQSARQSTCYAGQGAAIYGDEFSDRVVASDPIAPVTGGDGALAAAFIGYVLGPDGQATLTENGFEATPG